MHSQLSVDFTTYLSLIISINHTFNGEYINNNTTSVRELQLTQHNVRKQKYSAEQLAEKKALEKGKIEAYRGLSSQVNDLRAAGKKDKEALELNTKLLKINPEFYTMWNYRREVIKDGILPELKAAEERDSFMDTELRFAQECLLRFPKTYWIWTHRKWCLENADSPDWKKEMAMVSYALTKDERNFHAWNYRRYVLAKYEESLPETSRGAVKPKELDFTEQKINKNFSNFSAWHQRSKVIPQLMEENRQGKCLDKELVEKLNNAELFFNSEMEYVKNAIFMDPNDQSVWLYLRWLLTKPDIIYPDISTAFHQTAIENTIREIDELYQDEKDCRHCIYWIVFYTIMLYKLKGESIPTEVRDSLAKHLTELKDIDSLRKGQYEDWEKVIAVQ